ncbi:DUF6397 family protein [Streptomyces sp. DSM 3412]|uniref:DUF6397 family protein n=1 Tax=Streptomyces gottesmaniae TaxID=3075518 RepID=A0ABU2Z7U9_9ACTN|nr:DUF6397 family protein [Streptomyces sp. DSM 3412]MDT0572665.1 DUF6397 family protein [Streptomyces sp. DSM 3412]
MSGDTVTQSATRTAHTTITEPTTLTTLTTRRGAPAPAGPADGTLALGRAARELGLKRSELDLAVQLGSLRTVVDDGGGGRRITQAEIDRLRAEKGFPGALRERVEAVGSKAAAEILGVPPTRFMRLARLGLLTPVKFSLNRYRTVIWVYLAAELRQFAADERNAPWLTGRIPEDLRRRLDAGLDLRPRNWRGRHLGFLLRHADDPWSRAAAVASLLDPIQVAEIVQDPYERAHLHFHRPARADHGTPDSPAARITARIMTADDPDEIAWLRTDLQQSLVEARAHRLAPRARRKVPQSAAWHETPVGTARPTPRPRRGRRRPGQGRPGAGTAPEGRRGLLGWLRRGHH